MICNEVLPSKKMMYVFNGSILCCSIQSPFIQHTTFYTPIWCQFNDGTVNKDSLEIIEKKCQRTAKITCSIPPILFIMSMLNDVLLFYLNAEQLIARSLEKKKHTL
jgi:hypothetical protein